VFPFRLSRIGEAFFRINFFFQCNKALLKCDSPTEDGEGFARATMHLVHCLVFPAWIG
jgi:hypothetical protein